MTHILDRAARPPTRVLVGTARAGDVVDVYVPEGIRRGTVALIHGGFWREHASTASIFAGLRPPCPRTAGWYCSPSTSAQVRSVAAGLAPSVTSSGLCALLRGASVWPCMRSCSQGIPPAATSRPSRPCTSLCGRWCRSRARSTFRPRTPTASLMMPRASSSVRARSATPIRCSRLRRTVTSCSSTAAGTTRCRPTTGRYAARFDRIAFHLIDADHYDLIDPTSPAYEIVSASCR